VTSGSLGALIHLICRTYILNRVFEPNVFLKNWWAARNGKQGPGGHLPSRSVAMESRYIADQSGLLVRRVVGCSPVT